MRLTLVVAIFRYGWFYYRFKSAEWSWEFQLVARRVLLAAGVYIDGYPLLLLAYSIVLALSLVHHKRYAGAASRLCANFDAD